jgi:murein DD-endopeptidase MepM/ murein hydrolase activator NlpD
MKLKNIFIFFVALLLVACKKHDVSKVEQHTELKEWLKQNGEGYKNGVLQFKGANGEIKMGQLNWSQVKTYDIDGIVYTEVPFMFGEENKGEFRSNNSDTKVDVAFYLMLRTISGQIEGAIKVVQQNLALKANNETKTGKIESFRNLKNELVNIWFRESAKNNLIALKLAENQTWANAISSQSEVKSNTYTCITYVTQNPVVSLRCEATGPNSVDCYFIISSSGEFKAGCFGGSGADTEDGLHWPPTPPSSGSGNGTTEKKIPCPGDVIYSPKIAPSNSRSLNGGRYGLTRIDEVTKLPKFHGGLDIYALPNTQLYAAFGGKIVYIKATFNPNQYAKKSLGNFIVIESILQDGTKFQMTYAHLNYIDIRLNNGTIINQGDLIGLSGLTGNAKKGFSPHVHIQIKVNGKSENPENVLYTKYDNTGKPVTSPCY